MIEKVEGAQSTRFTLDLASPLTQVLADDSTTYLYGNTRLGQQSGGEMEYFLTDALGSVRQLANDTSIILAKEYEPYGEVLAEAGSGSSDYGYTGEWTSPYNEFVYLRARWSAQGRFLTRDTWGGSQSEPMSYNAWLYVSGNPINYADPNGLMPFGGAQDDPDAFYRFDKAIEYMYSEMKTNSLGDEAKWISALLAQTDSSCGNPYVYRSMTNQTLTDYWGSSAGGAGNNLAAYWAFYNKVKPGGDWDHKPKLQSLLNIGTSYNDQYFPIRGDDEYEYFYDIWSNIHYGYVGSAIGFDRDILQFFANMQGYVPEDWIQIREKVKDFVGEYDPGDAISVDIGVRLWQDRGYALSISDLHLKLLSYSSAYFTSQDINGNGMIDDDEIKPWLGKLLPPETEWSDWK